MNIKLHSVKILNLKFDILNDIINHLKIYSSNQKNWLALYFSHFDEIITYISSSYQTELFDIINFCKNECVLFLKHF